MFEKAANRAIQNFKRTLKEETIQCLDSYLPTLVGFASVIVYLGFTLTSPSKPVSQQIVINNYFLGK